MIHLHVFTDVYKHHCLLIYLYTYSHKSTYIYTYSHIFTYAYIILMHLRVRLYTSHPHVNIIHVYMHTQQYYTPVHLYIL